MNGLNQYTAVGVGSSLLYSTNGNLNSYNGWSDSFDAANRLTSAAQGATSANFYYDGLGRQIARTISAYNVDMLFTGQKRYPALGLYDLRARAYLPSLGRFLQPDPIGFAGDPSNIHRYCGNNPINWSDPSGLYNFQKISIGLSETVGSGIGLFILGDSDLTSGGLLTPIVAPLGAYFIAKGLIGGPQLLAQGIFDKEGDIVDSPGVAIGKMIGPKAERNAKIGEGALGIVVAGFNSPNANTYLESLLNANDIGTGLAEGVGAYVEYSYTVNEGSEQRIVVVGSTIGSGGTFAEGGANYHFGTNGRIYHGAGFTISSVDPFTGKPYVNLDINGFGDWETVTGGPLSWGPQSGEGTHVVSPDNE